MYFIYVFYLKSPPDFPPTMYLLQPGLIHVVHGRHAWICTHPIHVQNKNKNSSQFKSFTNNLRHYPSPLQRRSYLCSLSCHWSEPILYVLNGQKEHTRAFFVWTVQMWESIPILENLGVMLQFPHLYIFVLPPTLMWMGFSINSPDVPGVDASSSSISSASSLGSIFMGVGVGVVAIFRYLRSCGSSPTPTSEQVSSNDFHPSYTNWWPQATVRTAEITSRKMYL